MNSAAATLRSCDFGAVQTGAGLLPADDITGALHASHLHMRYQPIVAMADRRVLALEVLARLDHPDLGTLFPAQFVPQMEDAGLARQLTEAVIQTALADRDAYLGGLGLRFSLNFPLDVLMHPSFGEWLEVTRGRAQVAAERIIVELTESQPVADLTPDHRALLAATMQRMRKAGYRLAVDDWNPLMPRCAELFDLPFDLLKLDKSVVTDLAAPSVAEQAIAEAHRHGMQVVAEGVEDSATWQRMQDAGADYVQGFLVSRPLQAGAVPSWLESWAAG